MCTKATREGELRPRWNRSTASVPLLPILLLSIAAFFVTPRYTDAYITSHGALPVQRQRAWLKEMTDVIVNDVKLGQISSNQVYEAHELISAWSQMIKKGQTSHKKAENVLVMESLIKRLVDECRANESMDALVTVDDYNNLLEGWARSGLGAAAAERCELILEQMQEQGPSPNLSSFKAVLQAWKEPPTAPYNAVRMQRILEWMIRLYQKGDNLKALPDADCFDTVLQAWGRSKLKDAPRKAEQLLVLMERLYKSTGNPQMRPRTLSFNAVLATWSNAASTDATAADNACDILSFMEMLESRGDDTIAPDCCSYCTVAAALSKAQDMRKAAAIGETMLNRLETRYYTKLGKEAAPSAMPDTILYNTCMGMWAKSRTSAAYRRTRKLLDQQLTLYESSDLNPLCKPDVYSYTTVISSCASEPGNKKERGKAFQVAVKTFQELEEAHRNDKYMDGPNHVTYGAMLKSCARLIGPGHERSKWARELFLKCCDGGYVNEMAIRHLRQAVSPVLFKKLMRGHQLHNLPRKWTRSLPESEASFSTHRRPKKSASKFGRRRRAEV